MTKEKNQKQYEIHLVSHTHWDREWYDTFENFRVRLVKLIDKLLGIMESDKNFRHFVLDGQTVVLEDYLQIKPEGQWLLRKYISRGRILAGPWYILPDEFLESGESMIRNLLLGHKMALALGKVMKVGYVPDSFGHISQLPQILKGFNIDSFIFARGLSNEGEKLGSEFIWRSPDGSRVLAIRQSGWYGDSMDLGKEPVDFDKALEIINHSKKILSKYARTRYLLSNNGIDHQEPQPAIPKIIEYLNRHLEDAVIIHSNPEEFVEKIKKSAPQLSVFEGELRSAKYAPLLPGVMSSRMYLKQTNERTQTKLEKIAEPLAAMAWMEGCLYPKEILWQSWKYLLQCHPHDSICGCSIDQVHQDVMKRFAWSQQISDKIIDDSLDYLTLRIDTNFSNIASTPIVVFNTLNWKRTDVVKTTLLYSKKDQLPDNLAVFDEKGVRSSVQISRIKEGRWIGFWEVDVVFLVKDIPPYGYRTYFLSSGQRESQSSLETRQNAIENEYYLVEVKENGALKIKDKISGSILDGVLIFEDTEDAGDEYNFSPVKNSKRITSDGEKAKISLEESGPVAATLKIGFNLRLPISLNEDRSSRDEKEVVCALQTFVTLYSGIRRIDFRTVFENNVKDHRLRVLFPTDFKTDYCFAEGQFDVVKRKVGFNQDESSVETPCSTYPQQSFLSASDGESGLTLTNQGLPEYEAIPGKDGVCLALTLIRCVGWLSRGDFMTRLGNAGPSVATPEAQCLGQHEFRYSLTLHQGDWQKNQVQRGAYNHNVELLARRTSQHKGSLPKEFSFLELRPETLIVSAFKKAELKESLVLRAYSLEPEVREAEIRIHKNVRKVFLLNLEERVQNQLAVDGNKISSSIKPFQIVTLGIEFEER